MIANFLAALVAGSAIFGAHFFTAQPSLNPIALPSQGVIQPQLLPTSINQTSLDANALLIAVNEQRKLRGLSALTTDIKLNAISQEIADSVTNNHSTLDKIDLNEFGSIFSKYAYSFNFDGLNAYTSTPYTSSIIADWMNNGTTKANILQPQYNHVAFVQSSGVYGSAVFGIFTAPVKNTASLNSTDPIVSCNFPESGSIKMPSSQCAQMIDCQLTFGGKYEAVYKTDCDALRATQAKEAAKQVPADQVNCEIDGTVYQTTQADCTSAQTVAQQNKVLEEKIKEDYAKLDSLEATNLAQWNAHIDALTSQAIINMNKAASPLAPLPTFDSAAFKAQTMIRPVTTKTPLPQTNVYIECGFGHGC